MKIISFNKKHLIFAVLLICFVLTGFMNIVGYIFNFKYISVIAAVDQANKYEVRSRLLMDVMDQVGACDPKTAVHVWANGLVERSAALQYSVFTKKLKTEYARQLETSAPNWVTGVSSPWVDSYKIVKIQDLSKDEKIFELVFSTATSTGPAGDYKATLHINREGEFWRISKLSFDDGLYPYTRFKP
jgi:hypothetical protein